MYSTLLDLHLVCALGIKLSILKLTCFVFDPITGVESLYVLNVRPLNSCSRAEKNTSFEF